MGNDDHERESGAIHGQRAGRAAVAAAAVALFCTSCAAATRQPNQSASSSALPKVFVEAFLTTAAASGHDEWSGKTLEQIAALCEIRSCTFSNPNVLTAQDQPTILEFPANPDTDRSMDLVRYEVLVKSAANSDELAFKFDLRFGDGSVVTAAAKAKAQQTVLIPLENGLTIVAQGTVIESRADLQRIYHRKLEGAHERARRGSTELR